MSFNRLIKNIKMRKSFSDFPSLQDETVNIYPVGAFNLYDQVIRTGKSAGNGN